MEGVCGLTYPLFIPGFETHDLEVKPSGLLRGPRLLLDGNTALKGPKRNQYVLSRPDGSKIVVKLKPTLLDPVPDVFVDGEKIPVVEPLTKLQLIWCGLPIVMLFIGGALGGLLGGGTYWANILVFRSEMSTAEKYILTGLISGIAVLIFLISSLILPGLIHGLFN